MTSILVKVEDPQLSLVFIEMMRGKGFQVSEHDF